MLLNVQLNVVQVELSQSLQLDAKGPNGVLFTYSVRAFFIIVFRLVRDVVANHKTTRYAGAATKVIQKNHLA